MSGNTNSDIWIAGAAAAFTVDLLVYPLDTLKTRIQSPEYKQRFTHGAAGTVNRAALFRGLYQGVGSVIIATLPSSGAFFTTYEGVKHILNNAQSSTSSSKDVLKSSWIHLPQPLIHATASATAELVSCAILTPAEVIKQNAQMFGTSTTSDSSASKSTTPKENATIQTLRRFRSNPFALWSGYTALAGRNLPFTALQFPMFEWIKEWIKHKRGRDKKGEGKGTVFEGALITAISAGAAGSVAAVVTTPVDVIKTRVMLAAAEDPSNSSSESSNKASDSSKPTDPSHNTKNTKPPNKSLVNALGSAAKASNQHSRQSALQIAKTIIAKDGAKGLWRGGALRAVWTMVGSGLYLGVYEAGRIYLAKRRGEDIRDEELI